ncbi:VWA domain-containing protein [Candidatus Parcubacteria bacterium]|nr:VWA domain-containing protein [Candidatus Parcubacteria bacterium]
MPKNGQRMIVIATDGEPDNADKTLKIAIVAKNKGIKIICIGTDGADEQFLKKLFSKEKLGIKVPVNNFGKAIENAMLLLDC